MNRIRVMVVDDDSFTRELISALLCADQEITVVGEAADGMEALGKIPLLKPDLVTMDINMPGMDGLEAIRRIMSAYAVPILVITSSDDANMAYNAITRGALEVIAKPSTGDYQGFIDKVKLLSRVKVISHIMGARDAAAPDKRPGPAETARPSGGDRIVAIASSTGGPRALSALLAALPEGFGAPIVIAQHITDDFAQGMAKWLNGICRLTVKTGEAGETPRPGMVYLSPSERHMRIDRSRRIAFRERAPGDIYNPSCDLLLSSVARACGRRSIGVILTGMGSDGVAGLREIKAAGGRVIAQDQKTSVVFGMPRVAIESGCVDEVLPLTEIPQRLIKLVM